MGSRPGTARRDKALRWAKALAFQLVVVITVLSVRSVLADHYVVPTGSMLPTIELQDHLFVDKRAYGLRLPITSTYLVEWDAPEVGDVVVFASPEDGETLVKRVVGTPGDMVQVTDGAVIIDGALQPIEAGAAGLVETLGGTPHPLSLAWGGGPDLAPTAIPEDKYLVMGDNRGNSADGRYFGLVDMEAIYGEALGIWMRAGALTWEPL